MLESDGSQKVALLISEIRAKRMKFEHNETRTDVYEILTDTINKLEEYNSQLVKEENESKYPKYAKIHILDKPWYAKLDEDRYVSEYVRWHYEKMLFHETEFLSIADIEEDGYNVEEITEQEYIKSVYKTTLESYDTEIRRLKNDADNRTQAINKEKEKVEKLLEDIK